MKRKKKGKMNREHTRCTNVKRIEKMKNLEIDHISWYWMPRIRQTDVVLCAVGGVKLQSVGHSLSLSLTVTLICESHDTMMTRLDLSALPVNYHITCSNRHHIDFFPPFFHIIRIYHQRKSNHSEYFWGFFFLSQSIYKTCFLQKNMLKTYYKRFENR